MRDLEGAGAPPAVEILGPAIESLDVVLCDLAHLVLPLAGPSRLSCILYAPICAGTQGLNRTSAQLIRQAYVFLCFFVTAKIYSDAI